jgi:hypothetical protein
MKVSKPGSVGNDVTVIGGVRETKSEIKGNVNAARGAGSNGEKETAEAAECLSTMRIDSNGFDKNQHPTNIFA